MRERRSNLAKAAVEGRDEGPGGIRGEEIFWKAVTSRLRRAVRLGAPSFSFVSVLSLASLAGASPVNKADIFIHRDFALTKLELALPPPARELQAKIEECKVCHQPSGQGYRGDPPVPRLAGQQIEYIVNQLRAFIEHRRVHPIMGNVAQFLSPSMQRALAEHFKGLNPKPVEGAPKELLAAGEKIYEGGAPEAGVPPCAVCHGPDAKGNGPFPRLAGQLNDYIVNKLLNWNNERGQSPQKQDTSAIMQPIAHSLTKAQIEAVAAFLNGLE